MLRSRRLAFTAAAVLIGLTACGDDGARTTAGTAAGNAPAVIHLGGAQGSGGNAEVATADRMMMPMQDITFVWAGGDVDLGSTGAAWTLPAGTDVDTARIAEIARLLGVEGDVRELPADQGGGWMVGAADYSTASLTVSTDGMVSWWYNPAPSTDVSRGGCAMPGEIAVDPGVAIEGDGDVATADTVPADDVAVPPSASEPLPPDMVCEEPRPPANVPDSAAAEEQAKQLFAAMGYDTDSFEYEVYADEWGANVTAWLLLDGHRSPITLSAGFGAEGALTWASGSLATPQRADDYPLVSIDDAVQRLNDETGQWMAYMGGGVARGELAGDSVTVPSGETAGAPEPVPATDVAVAPPDATTGQIGEPVVIDQPVCDPATDCVIEEMPPLEPITITFTEVTTDLTMQWAEDGTIWLLPAYTFTSPDMGMYTVIAVDDSFIALPEPLPTPEPLPVETVPVDGTGDVPAETVVVAPAADCPDFTLPAPENTEPGTINIDGVQWYVGLCVADAKAAAETVGYTFRIVRENGVDLAVTMDYQGWRVNVAVENGIVTEIVSIG